MCAREPHYDAVRVIQSQGDKRPGLGWWLWREDGIDMDASSLVTIRDGSLGYQAWKIWTIAGNCVGLK